MNQGVLNVRAFMRERRHDSVQQRMDDLHTVLRIAVAVALGGVFWSAAKSALLAIASPNTLTYQSAEATGWGPGLIMLFALAFVLPLPRLIAVIFVPFWRWNRASAKFSVLGAFLLSCGKMSLAYGSIRLGDSVVTLQYVGDATFGLVAAFLVGVILNTDLKWERMQCL